MSNGYYPADDFEVDLKDLLMRVLLSWRMIIAFMLVGAAVLGSVGALRSYQQNREELIRPSDEAENNIASMKEALSWQERIEVEDTLNIYFDLWRNYKNLLEYQEHSLKMQLDPAQVIRITSWYRIDNHFQLEYPVVSAENNLSDIVLSYSLAVSDITIYNDVLASLNLDTAPYYLQELVEIDTEKDGVFSISVLTDDQMIGEELLDAVIRKIEEQTPILRQMYGNFDITELERQISSGLDQKLLHEQLDQGTDLNEAANLCRNLSSYMTSNQKKYYEALITKAVEDGEGVGEPNKETTTIKNPEVELFRAKYVILGAAMGGILACAWVMFRYLFSRKLRVVADLERGYQMPILGVFPEYANNKKKAFGGIDRWIQSLFYREHSSTDEVVALVTSRIEVIVDKLGLETLYITGTGNSEDSEMVRNALVRMLREEGVSVSEGISVVQDSQSLKRMAEADGVIFVEKIGESRYDDLKEEGSICQSYQIPVLGCVVLR